MIPASIDTVIVDSNKYYLPANVADLQALIREARQQSVQIRIRGANHSVPQSIYPDTSPAHTGIFVMLSKMYAVEIDAANKQVTVQAGCHLGYDPNDPTKISTQENGLFIQLHNAGFAVPDMGGIIHQTVGGFLSTGSSGGSVEYGFDEMLRSITFLPADSDNPQPVTLNYSDDPNNPFFAAGVAIGLFGIIVSATFTLVPKFNISGSEKITTVQDCTVDLLGTNNGGVPLQQFLEQTQYTRLVWWPQLSFQRAVVWQACQMQPDAPFTQKSYVEIQPVLGSEFLAQLLADGVMTAIGHWDYLLKIWFGESWNERLKKGVNQFFYEDLLPLILNQFVPLDTDNYKGKEPPHQVFEDYWYSGLPMDNNVSDKLIPVRFTELWIDINKTAEVMTVLNQMLTDYYNSDPGPEGDFSIEIYAAKASKFWMSPSYQMNVIRIDVFWFGNNPMSPIPYYTRFWDALKKSEIDFRPHWGKFMPDFSEPKWKDYLPLQYPQWKNFMQLRQQYDPQQVFVNDYWRRNMNIEPIVTAKVALV